MLDPAIAPATADPVELLLRLVESPDRAAAARVLARSLQGEALVALVLDEEVGVLLPAPGFPPTLDGGDSWRELVRRCLAPGLYEAEVDLPPGKPRRASALACGGLALVLLSEPGSGASLAALERYMPLLAFAFRAEQQARFARVEAAEARKAAGRARALAEALEAARADASGLNAELRAEHARKDHFLAMLAHELRNPLSPVVSAIDRMRLTAQADPALRQGIEVMTRHVRQLSQLVDDLLDVSRVSRGRIELRREPLAIAGLVREALEANQALLDSRQHAVELSLPEAPLEVDGDRVRLTQVFSNLIHNAAKYTDAGGRIRVRAWSERGRALVEVSDNGIGIDAATLPQIFTLFSQAPVSLARSRGGLGIGLTLVRALLELHGGSVEASSPGIGRGSTFTVALPLLVDAPRQPAAPPGPAAATRPLRILIVDDNADAADILGGLARMLGHHADVSYSSAHALQLAADSDADLVLLDIGLPEIDGFELAPRLRRVLRPDAYVVALSGYGGEQYATRARNAGFDEYAVKPATLETIKSIVARAAARVAGARG